MNKNTLLVVLLVVALAVILVLWMNDRESQDAELNIDLGSRDLPVLAVPA